ncbi:MAG: PD-(D/E)XK nuclease family protein [Dehalococcoidia bacterium]|nr:PD-(D/E)XK nuclease family protein [Dehalococcoidia bacterium]
MPVIGFDCPFKGKVDFHFCLRDAATQNQPCQFTYPVLKGMVHNERKLRHGIHVTSLLSCLRKVVLEQRHDLYVSPEHSYWPFRGQLAHAIVQMAQEENAVTERTFKRQVEGITIVGTPDVIYPEKNLLVDYKTTAMVPKKGPYPQHVLQVNIYRWLVQAHYHVDRMEIVYLDMKGAGREPVPVMPLEEVEAFILPRARILKRGLEGGELPPQIGEEGRWQCWGYCPFSHHMDCWGLAGPPERNRRETREESRKKAIRKSYAEQSEKRTAKGGKNK